jgi:hypothetical protein
VSVPPLRRWLPIAVYILVPSILVLPILFSGKMLYGADVVSVFHYSRIVISDAFRSGRLPIWDPHVMAGFPMLAEPQNAIFYPPTWLCVLMSAGTFWTLSAWAHLILAGVFAHRWLERGLGLGVWAALMGAFVFMMSGYIAGHVYAGHVNYVWAYPWIPALLWRLERFLAKPTLKRGVLLAVVFALLFLAGVPQFVLCVALMGMARIALFVLRERVDRRGRAFIAGRGIAWLGLGLLLCAPQLFPTLELVGEMHRGSGSTPSFLSQYSLPIRGLLYLVASAPRPGEPDYVSQYAWEWCGFIGGGAFLLGAAALTGRHPQRFLWLGIAAMGVLLALGPATPVYGLFVKLVPGAALFRGPGRYLLLFSVGATALAACGVQALWERDRRPLRVASVAIAGLCAIQLILFTRLHFLRLDTGGLRMPASMEMRLRRLCGLEGRVTSGFDRVENIGMAQAAGLDHDGGYEPMMLGRYAELFNAARGGPGDTDVVIVMGMGFHHASRMLGVRAAFSSSKVVDHPDSFPRAWVVNNAVVIEDKGKRLHTLGFGPWDPAKTVILETYPTDAPPVPTEKAAGKARVVSKGPGRYEIEAENDADAYLVLSEAYYPGWRAEVDGQAADVLPANHLIQTVRLPAGKHVVRFEYRSRFLGLGFALAALAALIPVGLLVRRYRRQLPLERLPGAP